MTNTITTGSNLTDEQWLNNAYLNTFGRSAVTGDADTGGGAQYWLDQMDADPTGHSRDEVQRGLTQELVQVWTQEYWGRLTLLCSKKAGIRPDLVSESSGALPSYISRSLVSSQNFLLKYLSP